MKIVIAINPKKGTIDFGEPERCMVFDVEGNVKDDKLLAETFAEIGEIIGAEKRILNFADSKRQD